MHVCVLSSNFITRLIITSPLTECPIMFNKNLTHLSLGIDNFQSHKNLFFKRCFDFVSMKVYLPW